jgi:hydrogenase expression/formation protein HypD
MVRYVREFHDVAAARGLAATIERITSRPVNLMEVCGTHTVAIFRHGIRQLLPPPLSLLSGPGCPVCVTTNADIDKAIALAEQPGVTLATFGDMMKVPGSYQSLQQAKADGSDVRVVYSPRDAVCLARDNPKRPVIFFAVGFETTVPTIAASLLEAEALGLKNFYLISVHKLIPPAMLALLEAGEVRIDGFICPGHVSVVIGSQPYQFIPQQYGVPCVITGFEPLDVLQGIEMLLRQIGEGPNSGLKLRPEYKRYDAEEAFTINPPPTKEHKGCLCGDILRGVKTPPECPLFAGICTPERPVGPCMVSSEGTCAGWYQYGSR